ncbi:hypothetical protein TNCV_3061461 [Trichonephila clavipes]|nr:hypothetical protein TNCV_3061461 [Trichonephila clavipes]
MTAREDPHLSIIARGNRGTTASQLSRYLYAATGTSVSRVTVSERLQERGLFARRLVVFASRSLLRTGDYTRAFDDGPRNFEPWSNDDIDIGILINVRPLCSPMSPVSA